MYENLTPFASKKPITISDYISKNYNECVSKWNKVSSEIKHSIGVTGSLVKIVVVDMDLSTFHVLILWIWCL